MQWRFVDTLDIVRAVGLGTVGGCGKLQCLMSHMQVVDSTLMDVAATSAHLSVLM